jgi:hypothetical protein
VSIVGTSESFMTTYRSFFGITIVNGKRPKWKRFSQKF